MKDRIIVVFSSHLGDDENNKFIEHIKRTIGIKNYEIQCFINYNQYSLSVIYNKVLNRYDNDKSVIILFVHVDIIFRTNDWGRILLHKFNNTNYGIIGVAGSIYIPESGVWWDDKYSMRGIVEHTDGVNTWVSKYSSEKRGGVIETIVVDGLFIAVNPTLIIHKFDEFFSGFHYYDLGFCMSNYLDGCNIGITTDIRILHKSIGITNEQWEINRKKFIEKYSLELPISILPQYEDLNVTLIDNPKVAVIIPTKNNFKYLYDNIQSWYEVVKYNNYEIIIADTGSDESVINKYDSLLSDNIRLVKYNFYNFAKINNDIVKNHIGQDVELLLFCNDDVLLLNDALSRCVEIYNQNKSNIGTVGIRLHYGNTLIQHCGISIHRQLPSNHLLLSHVDLKKSNNYCNGIRKSIGNTGAFLLISRELFNEIGCFNEAYIECLEDVELNLECILRNKINITACDAVAYHYESVSRNKYVDKDKNFQIDYYGNLMPYYMKNSEELNEMIKEIA